MSYVGYFYASFRVVKLYWSKLRIQWDVQFRKNRGSVNNTNMKLFTLFTILAIVCLQGCQGQFFNALRNFFGGNSGGSGGGGFNLFGGNRFRDDGTQAPVATGNDQLFPEDCED